MGKYNSALCSVQVYIKGGGLKNFLALSPTTREVGRGRGGGEGGPTPDPPLAFMLHL